MKISLNLGQNDAYVSDSDRERVLERDVTACRKGDWEAKSRVIHTFMPLLTSLARKRATETADINHFIEAGKEGLLNAARHYKNASSTKFQIFALGYIEASMNKAQHPGLFARMARCFRRS